MTLRLDEQKDKSSIKGSGKKFNKQSNSSASKEELVLGSLPSWDLSALYNGIDDKRIEEDLSRVRKSSRRFSRSFRGKLSNLTARDLGRALRDYESLSEQLSRLASFAFLQSAENLSDGTASRFRQSQQELLTEIEKDLLFFGLELNLLSDDFLEERYKVDSRLRKYECWITALRRFRPYQLSEELEEFLSEKSLTSHQAWITLYDESEAALRFSVGKRSLILSEVLHLLSDRDGKKRERAAKALGAGLRSQASLLTMITNTLAQDKLLTDNRRGFKHPIDSRNLDNRISSEVVASLTESVRAFYPRLSHRYYRLKAGWLSQGLDKGLSKGLSKGLGKGLSKDRSSSTKLAYWDRGAPFPHSERRLIPWLEARDLVLESYGRFSPEMGEICSQFFANDSSNGFSSGSVSSWIDAGARAGKMSGAFSHPCVPSAHPYILMSYRGKTRDVMTLAHELGHGINQVLASRLGYLLAATPLTLAETASVFGERLTFDLLLERASSKSERCALLAGKIEDMLNTVVRQISFLDFETRVHDARKSGPLSSDQLCEIWLSVSRESLGDIFDFDVSYNYYWGYISHFIHAPFYVYSYAFGDCLVNVLYGLYRDGMDGFAEKYLDLLRSGGSRDYRDILLSFGLDASDGRFWQRGLLVIEEMINDLESLLNN